MKFYCIADEDTVRGFRLAGIAGQVVTTAQQAAAAVEEAARTARRTASSSSTEKVAAGIRQQVDAIRLERERPADRRDSRTGRALAGTQKPAAISCRRPWASALARAKGA